MIKIPGPKKIVSEKYKLGQTKHFHKKLTHAECTNTTTIALTRVWKKHFPKRSSEFTFKNEMVNCNYLILIYILRTYNNDIFRYVNIYSIKLLLYRFYEPLMKNKSNRNKIYKKWKQENKKELVEQHKKGTSLDAILMSETYHFTVSDLCLFVYELKIPVVIYFQTKRKTTNGDPTFKTVHFDENNEENDTFFFVRYSRNKFHLNTCEKRIQIQTSELSDAFKQDLKTNTVEDFEHYLQI